MAQELEDFLNYLSSVKNLSPNTIEAYRRDLTSLFEYVRESHDIENPLNITRPVLQKYFRELFNSGYSRRSIRRKHSAIRRFFNYLLINGKIKFNPATGILHIKLDKPLPDVVSEEKILKMLDSWEPETIFEIRNKAIIETLYSTGIRASELTGIKIQDLDIERREVRVMGKGNKERIVPLGTPAFNAIFQYIQVREKFNPTSDILFVTKSGKKLSRDMVWRIVTTVFKKLSSLYGVHPHTLRHSFATHMLSNGADLRSIQELLGHENISTTEIYLNLTLPRIKRIYDLTHPRKKR